MMLKKNSADSSNYKLRLSDDAFKDMFDVLYWYELQNEKLSKKFYKDLTKTFNKILNYPGSYQKITNNVR
jgi:hypothetical protein